MRNASSSRREPQSHLKGFFTSSGFTAVELLVFLAVAVIITSLAIPSWNGVMEREQVVSRAETLAAFISDARIDSIMRERPVTVSYAPSTGDYWCVGVAEGREPCDCREHDARAPNACSVDGTWRVFAHDNTSQASILDRVTGDGTITFDPLYGTLRDPGDTAEMMLVSAGGRYSLSVHVGRAGDVRICSQHSGTQVPGFRLC